MAGCELSGRARRWARQKRQPAPAPPRALGLRGNFRVWGRGRQAEDTFSKKAPYLKKGIPGAEKGAPTLHGELREFWWLLNPPKRLLTCPFPQPSWDILPAARQSQVLGWSKDQNERPSPHGKRRVRAQRDTWGCRAEGGRVILHVAQCEVRSTRCPF